MFNKGLINQFDGWFEPINDNDFQYCLKAV